GKFRDAGFAIPLSLLFVLLATLTFSPAVLRLTGRWAFWPQHKKTAEAPGEGRRPGALQRIWDRMGQALLRRPGRIWLVTTALMAPFVIVAGLFYGRVSYDLIGDLPADAPSVAGTQLLQEHFPAGMLGPATVLIEDPNLN